jgi:tripartite-type tricarboxylate transporter receptor subunit TctC
MSIGSWPTQVVNGAVYALSYDLQTDVEPIALLVSNPALILAKKAMPADDLSSLVAWLRANPGMASLGTAGVGSGGHVNGVFLQNITGTRFQIVPYRGDGPAMQDLIAGQIDLLFGSASSLPQVRSGVIKAYAVMAKQRLPGAPESPHGRRSWIAGVLLLELAFALGSQRGIKGHYRKAQ